MKRSLAVYGLLIILALFAPLSSGTSPLYAQAPTDSPEADIGVQDEAFELEVIRLANLERTSRGLHPLIRNSSLTNAARAHNQDMIANNFFDHIGSDSSTPAPRLRPWIHTLLWLDLLRGREHRGRVWHASQRRECLDGQFRS